MGKRKNIMGKVLTTFLTSLLLTLVLYGASPALAATTVNLRTAGNFSVLAYSAITNTGASTSISGNIGLSPTTGTGITGFTLSQVMGTIYAVDASGPAGSAGNNPGLLTTAKNDLTTAYLDAAARSPVTIATELNGQTVYPGVYNSADGTFMNSGTLTLDAQGDPNAVFIFQTASTLKTATSSVVNLTNNTQPCNVFWQVGSSATIDTGSNFSGNILALTSITLNTGANLFGRALAQNGAVTMQNNTITSSVCAMPTTPPRPTLGKGFNPFTINETNNVSTLTITLFNPSTSIATLTAPLIDTLPAGVMIANPPNNSTTCGGGTADAIAGGLNVTLSSGSTIPAAGTCIVKVDVTALHNGSYINTLSVDTLQTDHGNNTNSTFATLTVVPLVPPGGPPMLGKGFSPFTINEGGVSTLTITLSNPNTTDATLIAPLIDTLPAGVTIANPPNANTTCGNGTANATAGGSNVTLSSGSTIPGNSTCTVTVNVTAPLGGNYFNTLPANTSLQTRNGNNTNLTIATLTVITQAPAAPVPAFTPIGIAVLSGLLALVAIVTLRRRL